MPPARTVYCPRCGAEREGVKAQRGTWLRCPSCGGRYRSPEPPADEDTSEGGGGAPRTRVEAPSPTPPASGPTVVAATTVTVKARPPKTDDNPGPDPRPAPSSGEGGRPQAGDPPSGGDAPPHTPEGRENIRRRVAQERGRRGGVNFYRDRVLRGG